MKKLLFKLFFISILACSIIFMFGCSSDDNPIDPNPNDSINPSGTVTDIDGNIYQTVTIGNQIWMAENLKVTHYRNGDEIPHVTDYNVWRGLKSAAYCSYSNNIANSNSMGMLYNEYTVIDNRNLAPAGWHIPTDDEWQTLIGFLGGDHVAGGKLKEIGVSNWKEPNTGATNESKFTALPAGERYRWDYQHIGSNTYFWSSTIDPTGSHFGDDTTWSFIVLSYESKNVIWDIVTSDNKGISVRCVKD